MCPICEYSSVLNEFDVCPNCGFQFEYDDVGKTIEELKELYEEDNSIFWRDLENE